MKKSKNKKLILSCECVGGLKYCGRVEFWQYDDSVEINVFDRGNKKVKGGAWMTPKNIPKIIKFLQSIYAKS